MRATPKTEALTSVSNKVNTPDATHDLCLVDGFSELLRVQSLQRYLDSHGAQSFKAATSDIILTQKPTRIAGVLFIAHMTNMCQLEYTDWTIID